MMLICSPEGDTVCKNSSEFLAEQASEIKRGDDDNIVDGVKVLQDQLVTCFVESCTPCGAIEVSRVEDLIIPMELTNFKQTFC